jgi:acyl-CoA thioester hydrolase
MMLVTNTLIQVRFSEIDSMGVVWHGHYIKYLEDGREDFGRLFNISYMEFLKQGILVPVVKINCDYKKPLFYGDTARVETLFVNCESAKLQYNFTIYNHKTNEIVAKGMSLQVFLNLNHELQLFNPPFFLEWKKRHLSGKV